ncbi:MAG TPA: hypothetical protein VHY31_26410 [Streptosporangiaceae bacterium]|nr:hypothetical protein [Streptosporangiaceae bacterium]
MRYRLMATYGGVPYEAGIGPTEDDVVLFAACPPPEELGFEPATGHWRKQLRLRDVQALWESRPMGRFRGDPCIVLDDLGDRLHIAYLGHDAHQAEKLGYWQVDRGVFELITPRDEVLDIVEERVDYPHHRAAGADSASVPAAPLADADAASLTGPPAAPDLTGPHAAVNLTGPHAAVSTTGAQPAVELTGPQPAVGLTGPHAAGAYAAGPYARGPQDSGSYDRGPQDSGSHDRGPQDSGSHGAGLYDTGPQPAGPGYADDAESDLAVIPPTSEPQLPLEAAARRAASAAASIRVVPHAPREAPSQAAPAPAPTLEPKLSRRQRSELRKLATQRIFSELASLAAIPPSAYAVGQEVDGAMCLIQTPDGFEVFNAAGGARHEVRIFDDEESAYFYLFGVLAAEAVRTGRLVPRG